MTQEQLEQIEAWRESLDEKQNHEHIVNAMWLSEEMWERHHVITRRANEIIKLSGSKSGNEHKIEFGTYMMMFCVTLMEYIWLPHDIIKAITADLDDLDTMPEDFICIHRESRGDYMVRMSYMGTDADGHDYEIHSTLKICDTKTEAEALTAILNHANKAGHDAVKRLSA
jgi:hypothetical protein